MSSGASGNDTAEAGSQALTPPSTTAPVDETRTPRWDDHLKAMFTVLLGASYSILLATNVPTRSVPLVGAPQTWAELPDARWTWLVLVLGSLFWSLDSWYNFHLHFEPRTIGKGGGVKVGTVVVALLICAFLPFQFISRFFEQRAIWGFVTPLFGFLVNMILVAIVDVVTKLGGLSSPREEWKKVRLTLLAVARPLAAAAVGLVILLENGGPNIEDAQLRRTWIFVAALFAYRIVEHFAGLAIIGWRVTHESKGNINSKVKT